jgi:hypothetical protein
MWKHAMQLRLSLFMALAASPTLANPLEKELASASNTCWERTYNAAHLAAHPKQLTAKIRLLTEVQEDGSILASIGVNPREPGGSGRFDYVAYGHCKPKGGALTCASEWDAGSFTLEKISKGGMKVKNSHMIVNPFNYDSEDISDKALDLGKSDDAVWLLARIGDEGCDLY